MAMRTRDTQSHDFNSLEQGKDTKSSTDKPKKVFHRKSYAVKALEELKFENNKYKSPSFRFPPKPKYSDSTTIGLIKCVIDFIKLKGFQVERINNTEFNGKALADELGSSYIQSVIKGKIIKIEIKCAAIVDDKQSEGQIVYQEKNQSVEGIYLIVKSFEDFYLWFNTIINGKQ